MGAPQKVNGPDLSEGIDAASILDGATLHGHVKGESVLLSRRGASYFAVGGTCTHYGALLADGLIDGDHAYCPLHHACFHLRTGEALTAPAFEALKRWRVDVEDGSVFVRATLEERAPQPTKLRSWDAPRRIVIVGGGAAGFAAADMLRRRGYDGELTMLSGETAAPVDRPNLSKDYLSGEAPEEWMPLRTPDFYQDNKIALRLATPVFEINPRRRRVFTSTGEVLEYDRLLLATGSTPVRPTGFVDRRVFVLRTLTDAQAILAAARSAERVVVVGAGFIGLEVAASLRAHGLDVDVVTPEPAPMSRLLGSAVAHFLRVVHEGRGVRFHFGQTAKKFDGRRVHLSSGTKLAADFVVLGVGVRPNIELAASAGLRVSTGVHVDAHLRTSDPSIFAAGDVARFPDPTAGEMIRIEHWAVAQQQGQTAAINMFGGAERFCATPFFWSNHYEHSLHYVGHVSSWSRVEIDGVVGSGDFIARYSRGDRLLAAASVGRARDSIRVQLELKRASSGTFQSSVHQTLDTHQ